MGKPCLSKLSMTMGHGNTSWKNNFEVAFRTPYLVNPHFRFSCGIHINVRLLITNKSLAYDLFLQHLGCTPTTDQSIYEERG